MVSSNVFMILTKPATIFCYFKLLDQAQCRHGRKAMDKVATIHIVCKMLLTYQLISMRKGLITIQMSLLYGITMKGLDRRRHQGLSLEDSCLRNGLLLTKNHLMVDFGYKPMGFTMTLSVIGSIEWTIDSLMEAMQDLWPEYMDFDQRAYAVNPQPDPIDSNVFHVLIEFMARGELAPRDHVPVVQDWMDWTETDENHHRQAQYIDETATRQELLHAADWRECEPEGRHVCDVWIGDQRCPWQGEHGAQHGCFVTMTRHAPIIVPAEFDFDRFPDIVLCLRIMLGRRLGRPGMGIALVGHVVDLFGHAQGWRMQEVDRAIPQDPVRLVQELLDLWPGEDFRQIVFFPHLLLDLQEEYHFALVQPSDGMVTILVQGEIGHVDSTAAQSFHHAIMIPARATLELVMSRLGLQRYFQADCQLSLQCQGLPWTFVNPCYDGLTLELDIQLPGQAPQAEEPDGHQVEGTPEVDEEDNVNFLQLSAYITPVGTGE